MKFDLHTHHERCGHAIGTIRDYVEAGIRHGLQVIGISDHSPYFASGEDQAQPGIAMAKSEFSRYIDEVLKLKAEYAGRIEVLLGVESDFFPEHAETYRAVYAQYPFDYIIGSVHLSGGVSIFNRKRWKGLDEPQQVEQKEIYYDLIEQSARSGMFQILGHIDAMRGYYPAFSDIKTEAVDRTLKVIGERNIAIEINTSGKTKDCGGWYPIHEVLERAFHYNVPVTFGSDAHVPDRVGDDWDEVAATLKSIGYREWVYFKEKRPVSVPL
ncbi:histidinol-phosphatase (PHP family) [Paenibacillus sp. UNCCL117]|uniref:histidinol-phosphatase n=1 Tax=unclassified Paenibacillus TaxID=185978 RepID=UPI000889F20A|nr:MULTISPECIES: histidinol-phosphatase [unclassified Paenibacillus]SDD71203.1 histidinol-phosphatase (PHP family) [Paenibacillus sp. cl123]SFW45489.1 histidinol-phosphatase (PHP family) [Paenibacillus sp. UNCCL117]